MDPAHNWIWHAWFRLHRGDRPHVTAGFAVPLGGTVMRPQPLPLPWTVLRTWADRYGYSEEDFELFDQCAQAMDEVYLRWWAEAQKTGA